MKKLMAILLLVMMALATATAETIVAENYTDVPTAMTQDSVVQLLADQGCGIQTLAPDEASVALLDSIYRFVWEEKNRPARYYDVPTQQKIAALAECDIDILHMTEAMRLQLTGSPAEAVTATMRLDVDYSVGQLVVAVLGVQQPDGTYVWYPYRGRVETQGEIKWEVPVEEWQALSQQPVSFHVLSDRIGPRGGKIWGWEIHREHTPPSFSKGSSDVIKIRYWYDEWGNRIEDLFRLWLVDLTDPMQQELRRIGEHVAAGGRILDYFPEDRRDEALKMLPADTEPGALVAYDVIALRAEEYKDTYGDVTAELLFGTAYDPEKAMVILAGFPVKGAQEAPYMDWYVLRAEAMKDNETVEIGLKQLNLARMEEEPMMLVVISEVLDQK